MLGNELVGFRQSLHSKLLSNLQDLSRPFFFLQVQLERSELYPGLRQVRKFLTIFFIQQTSPIQFTQLLFQADVSFKHFLLG